MSIEQEYDRITGNTLIVEYKLGKYLLASANRPHFIKLSINRNREEEIAVIEDKSYNERNFEDINSGYSDLQLLIGFDYNELPYCVAKG